MNVIKRYPLIFLLCLNLLILSLTVEAAPGELSNKPLFLGNSMQPNILFILDDSGSMDWEILKSNGAQEAHPDARHRDNLDFTPDSASEVRELCSGYNVMAYDPTKTYTPWAGKDKDGDTFVNMSVDAAYSDPYEKSGKTDISSHFFITWNDSNNDEYYQSGECDTTGAISSGSSSDLWSLSDTTGTYTSQTYSIGQNSTVAIDIGTNDKSVFDTGQDYFNVYYRVDGGTRRTLFLGDGGFDRRDLNLNVSGNSLVVYVEAYTSHESEIYYLHDIVVDGNNSNNSCPSCVFVSNMTAQEKANYANWYTYYRKREYVAKRALSEIIYDGRSRMGLATLHNNNSVGTPIKDVDDISSPDVTAASNKEALLDNLAKVFSSGGTPLRSTLERAGKYFEVGVSPGSDLFGFTPNPTSPILSADEGGACQQNFSILLSDGHWNGNAPSVGNTDGGVSNSRFDGDSYADNHSNTLADVAMHYFERDLAPALANNVPITAGIDTNTAQHMVTFTVAFGIDGTLTEDPPNRADPFSWPEPEKNSPQSIDDMRHAAWNGRGEFLDANDPQELIDSLGASISSIQDRTGSASAVAFNTTSYTANTYVYQARFDAGNWSGQLYAFEFDENGVGEVAWEASSLLNDPANNWADRNVYTYRADTGKGIPFTFPANYKNRLDNMPDDSGMNEIQIRDILANAPFSLSTIDSDKIAANQQFGERVVNYLRGDFTDDGNFRDRQGKRLGDIVHSSPEYVGKPSELYPHQIESVSYYDYVTAQANRTPVIYVGSNTGMLHAFHADQGHELFAYVPGALYSDDHTGLHKILEQDYSHIPYVDGSPVSRDVFINGSWKTYLVGGYRAGGKGVYVLDVTNPANYTSMTDAAADNLSVMEFTHMDLGYTFSNPQIAKLNNGKWAAIFGNGYNNDPNGDGKAKLFLLYLDGSGYKVLETNAGNMVNNDCQDSGSDCNGLSSPTLIDENSDFIVDRIYAGDLQGNMWAFDVSSTSTSQWKSAFGTVTSPEPLFTACSSDICNASGRPVNRQPITTKPIAIAHPSVTSSTTFPNVMVLFGTGQYIAIDDNANRSKQSFYGIWDAGNNYGDLRRSDLVAQTISYPDNPDLPGGRALSSNDVTYNPTTPAMGWYIDLQEPNGSLLGERVVVDPIVASDFVFFNTTIPNDEACSSGGSGFLMVADTRTGGQPDRQVFENFSLGNRHEQLVNTYAGIPINAVPGGGSLINGDTVVVSDSLGRVITADFNPMEGKKNSRRSSWSVVK